MEKHVKKSVTIVMPCIARPRFAKVVIKSVLNHFSFPYNFIAIIRPPVVEAKKLLPPEVGRIMEEDSRIEGLVQICKQNRIKVIRDLYFPYAKYWRKAINLCKTKYLFNLNCDFELQSSIKPMLDFMEANIDVGACATSIKSSANHLHPNARYGVDISYVEGRYQRSRCFSIRNPPKKPYHYCGHVHNGATLFRMEIFNDVEVDPNYDVGMGHEHEDLFLQMFVDTKWKVVSYNAVVANALSEPNPRWYSVLRNYGKDKTLKYFLRKWKL